jgi:hypothetical protein
VKVGDENYNNPSVPDFMGLEEELALQLRRKMGLPCDSQATTRVAA